MPMFKSGKNAHNKTYNIWYYLTKKHDPAAEVVINISDKHADSWYHIMDKTRKAYGNDQPWNGAKAITYRHCVISPDPKDNATPEQCVELARRWLEKHFPEYQAAIVVHTDTGIPHAHIVINNTNLETGRRLNITTDENERILPNSANHIAKQMGLSTLPELELEVETPTLQPNIYRFTESKYLAKGRLGWKEEIRLQIIEISQAANGPLTFDEFKAKMQERGYDVNINRRGGYTFQHCNEIPNSKNHEHWKVKGEKLGFAYTPAGLALFYNIGAELPESKDFFKKEKVKQAKRSNLQRQLRTEMLSDLTLQDRYDALDTIRTFGIGTTRTFDSQLAFFDDQLKEIESQRLSLEEQLRADSLLMNAIGDVERYSQTVEKLNEYAAQQGVDSYVYEHFYNSHQKEIEAYKSARSLLSQNGVGASSPEIESFKEQATQRRDGLSKLNDKSASIEQSKGRLLAAKEVYTRVVSADKKAQEAAAQRRYAYRKQSRKPSDRDYGEHIRVRERRRVSYTKEGSNRYKVKLEKERTIYGAYASMEAANRVAQESVVRDEAAREARRAEITRLQREQLEKEAQAAQEQAQEQNAQQQSNGNQL